MVAVSDGELAIHGVSDKQQWGHQFASFNFFDVAPDMQITHAKQR